MTEEALVKVHIDLPLHWAIGGESIWAKPLGNDLYRIENVPFYAYGLNFHDIVKAISENKDLIPEVREIIEPSGHRTFRVFFENHVSREDQENILNTLDELTISYERTNNTYFSLDMQPTGDYQSVYDRLCRLEEENLLAFETCEARAVNSFDDVSEINE